jgi:hypothetical protein
LVLAGVLELEKLLASVLFNGCVVLLGSGRVLRRVQIQKILPELLGHVFYLLAGRIAVRECGGGRRPPSPRVPKRQSAMIRYCPVAFAYGGDAHEKCRQAAQSKKLQENQPETRGAGPKN